MSELSDKNMNNTCDTKKLESRVDRLEVITENLANNVTDLAKQMKDMASAVNSVREDVVNELRDLRKDMTDAQKPDWNNLWAYTAVILTIISITGGVFYLIMSNYNEDINRNTNKIELLEKEININKCDIVRLQVN